MTIEQLKAALPRAGSRLDLYGGPLLEAMAAAGIDTLQREAHFLSQVGHESGDLLYSEELASGATYEGRTDLGNTQPGDGRRYKGRGLIQLTGRTNYATYGAAIGRDLLTDPGVVSREPALCVGVATWFWATHGLNALADADDCEGITRRINGGTNGLADRRARLEIAKAVLLAPEGVEA
jgi:putative chitinase